MKLTAKRNTIIKSQPINSQLLSDNRAVKQGTTICFNNVTSYGKHTKVDGKYLFSEHWDVNPDLLLPTQIGDNKNTILMCATAMGYSNTQKAYLLATIDHETNHTFEPVKEAYWLSEAWRMENLTGYSGGAKYYGRGYVQLTHDYNYKAFSKILGIDLLSKPDLVMQPEYSTFVICYGMKYGTFTTKKLSQYVNATTTDFVGARKVINGKDKAEQIALLANKWLKQL